MKRSLIAQCFTVAVLLCCCMFVATSYAADKVINLRFAYYTPSTSIEGKTIEAWCTEVEKRTNGRVKIKTYPGATLIPAAQTYDGITKEVADIGYGVFAYHRGRFPMMEVIDLPLGYKNPAVPTMLVNEFYKKFKPKELDDVKVLFLEAHGPGILSTKKPVSKLEDIQGMKIRATGTGAKIITALGASAVGLPITDAYDALSKGVVEGVWLDWGGVYNWNLGDTVKYHLQCPGIAYSSAFYNVMNKDKWNSLPPDIKEIINKLNEEWIETLKKKWSDWEATGRAGLQKKGNTIATLSSQEDARWVTKVKPVLDDYVKAAKAKGLPGDQALKFCKDYLKAHDK